MLFSPNFKLEMGTELLGDFLTLNVVFEVTHYDMYSIDICWVKKLEPSLKESFIFL